MDRESKPFYLSKTLWVNVLTIVAAILTVLSQNETLHDWSPFILIVLGLINTGLRLITTKAVTLK